MTGLRTGQPGPHRPRMRSRSNATATKPRSRGRSSPRGGARSCRFAFGRREDIDRQFNARRLGGIGDLSSPPVRNAAALLPPLDGCHMPMAQGAGHFRETAEGGYDLFSVIHSDKLRRA